MLQRYETFTSEWNGVRESVNLHLFVLKGSKAAYCLLFIFSTTGVVHHLVEVDCGWFSRLLSNAPTRQASLAERKCHKRWNLNFVLYVWIVE